MQQLSAHDARFLYSDTLHSNANVTLIHIYDQSTAPAGRVRFKHILAHIENRLGELPLFRQKLRRVPLELDYPYWVDDEHFDLEYHVRHIALPEPGDWRQFCIQASRIHARPLDLARPLWEIYVIEGLDRLHDLPEGSFALLAKTHRAAIDVERGAQITQLLHDLSATPPPAAPAAPWFAQAGPGDLSLLARSLRHSLRSAWRLPRQALHDAPAALRAMREALREHHSMPVTRFNAVVSPHRVFETRRFALSDFEAIRGLAEGATLNDAVLAVCGGALRRYLLSHEELPAASLVAMTPTDALDQQGNIEPHWQRTLLRTDIDDALQRLAAIRDQQRALAPPSEDATTQTHAPPATLAMTAKLLARTLAGVGARVPLANCTLTHVAGPTTPLYLCGARMRYFSAIMPIADGMGLVFAVTSYDGRLVISPTSCRELMPDPQDFAHCLRESFEEYLQAAQPVRRRRNASEVSTAATPRASAPDRPAPKARRA